MKAPAAEIKLLSIKKEIKMLLLSRKDVEEVFSFREVIDVVENAQRALGNRQAVNGKFDKVKVPAEMLPEKHANFMSFYAYLGKNSLNIAGSGWMASCIHNPTEHGLPYAVGLQIISDTVTGIPLAIMDMSRLTEMVTAATSAVGAKYLARKDSKAVGIIGCGNQGRTHLQALKELFNIKTVKAFDGREESLEKYVDEMGEKTGIDIQPASDPEGVIKTSDIVVIAISPVGPVLKYEWIKQGSLIIAMCGSRGGWAYDYENLHKTVDKFFTYNFDTYEMPAELIEIIAGRQKGRENNEEKIVFAHPGMSITHVAAAYLVYKKAKEKRIGTEFKII